MFVANDKTDSVEAENMIKISSYKSDILLGLFFIAVICAYITWLDKHPLWFIIPIAVSYFFRTVLLSKQFLADDKGLLITGPIYFFLKKEFFAYADITEARFQFFRGSGGLYSFRLFTDDGKVKTFNHNINRKRFTPILKILSRHNIPVIIHDTNNEDLLKQGASLVQE